MRKKTTYFELSGSKNFPNISSHNFFMYAVFIYCCHSHAAELATFSRGEFAVFTHHYGSVLHSGDETLTSEMLSSTLQPNKLQIPQC
jgi:hypothetical protein